MRRIFNLHIFLGFIIREEDECETDIEYTHQTILSAGFIGYRKEKGTQWAKKAVSQKSEKIEITTNAKMKK